jgi:farnesyl diphosphate synthase
MPPKTRALDPFQGWLAKVGPAVEDGLQAALEGAAIAAVPDKLHQAMGHALLEGGKRIRPALCLLACEAAGGSRADALPAALAVEMIHAYSLVHDDLPCMDDDALRRGRPSVHAAFGEATAVLAGDALQALAFETLAVQADATRARDQLRVLAAASGRAGMVGGQVLDMEAEGVQPDAEMVSAIHRAKTGALFSAAVLMGVRAAGGDGAAWAVYADAIGRLFQATDDLLDATATTAEIGKTAGKDQVVGKATLVAALGLDGARAAAESAVQDATTALPVDEANSRYNVLADLPRMLLARCQ